MGTKSNAAHMAHVQCMFTIYVNSRSHEHKLLQIFIITIGKVLPIPLRNFNNNFYDMCYYNARVTTTVLNVHVSYMMHCCIYLFSGAGNVPMAFLSYQPLWSIHCLISSIGGWAPYTSSAGMLRSSMKKINFLPRGGPNIPLRRLSSLESMMSYSVIKIKMLVSQINPNIAAGSDNYHVQYNKRIEWSDACIAYSSTAGLSTWVWLADVLAEKANMSDMYLLGIVFNSLSLIVNVLPVPVGPTQST